MEQQMQRAQVSLNIKRGLVATAHACMNHLKRRGIPAHLADGLGEVLETGIQESVVIPSEEIKLTDIARALGVLRKKGRKH
jgi:hypothetical protein